MKASRLNITILLVLIAIFALPLIAEAGVFGWISGAKDFVFDHIIATITGLFFALVSGFFAKTKWGKLVLKFETVIRGLITIADMIYDAKKKESRGGTKMTKEELSEIVDKIAEIAVSTVKDTTGKTIKIK